MASDSESDDTAYPAAPIYPTQLSQYYPQTANITGFFNNSSYNRIYGGEFNIINRGKQRHFSVRRLS